MNGRREFLKFAPAISVPALAGAAFSNEERAGRGEERSILGSWNTVPSLPFPPGSFREFLSFAEGGAVHETNSFLHTSSNSNFSAFGLPSTVNASDGLGNWWRLKPGVFAVVFRKLLFDGAGVNFADLHVTGTLTVHEGKLAADWHIEAVDPSTGAVIVDLGTSTSEGARLN